MKLKTLLKDIDIDEVKGNKQIDIRGITSHSKTVAPGDIFIAKRGKNFDGAQFIQDAMLAGAVAVVTDIYNPFLNITQIITKDIESIEAILAKRFYEDPSKKLFIVGITGTNGKTTVAYLTKYLLDDDGCGLVGTIETIIGEHHLPSRFTTHDCSTNQKLLFEMTQNHLTCAALEVSSHALDQNRCEGIDFDVAVFTNLTQDHLDYHKTMENYGNAKAKLFSSLTPNQKFENIQKTAVINIDDPFSKQLKKRCVVNVVTYGIDHSADLRASNIHLGFNQTSFSLEYKNQKIEITTPLIGRHNIYNLLAAMASALVKGLDIKTIQEKVANISLISGRLQSVKNTLGLHIYIDYAHTPDALYNILSMIREISHKRIFTVFGCGGSRDIEKRSVMMHAAIENSDFVIVTTDNPRFEDPSEIVKDMIKDVQDRSSYHIQLDRREAIKYAIEEAEPGDVILIAGKGHETQQIFATKTVPFDDYKQTMQLCEEFALIRK